MRKRVDARKNDKSVIVYNRLRLIIVVRRMYYQFLLIGCTIRKTKPSFCGYDDQIPELHTIL